VEGDAAIGSHLLERAATHVVVAAFDDGGAIFAGAGEDDGAVFSIEDNTLYARRGSDERQVAARIELRDRGVFAVFADG